MPHRVTDRRTFRRSLEFAVVTALVAAAVFDFVRVDRASHSASDTLLAWAPHAGLSILIGWALIAAGRRFEPPQRIPPGPGDHGR